MIQSNKSLHINLNVHQGLIDCMINSMPEPHLMDRIQCHEKLGGIEACPIFRKVEIFLQRHKITP